MTISQTLDSVERNRDAVADYKKAEKISHIAIAICAAVIVAKIVVETIKG